MQIYYIQSIRMIKAEFKLGLLHKNITEPFRNVGYPGHPGAVNILPET